MSQLYNPEGGNALLLRGSDDEIEKIYDMSPIFAATAFLRGRHVDSSSIMSNILTGADCQVVSSLPHSIVFASECTEDSSSRKCLVEVASVHVSRAEYSEIVDKVNGSEFPTLLRVAQHRRVLEDFNSISLIEFPEGVDELKSVGDLDTMGEGVKTQIVDTLTHLTQLRIWSNLHSKNDHLINHAFAIDPKTERVYLVSLATLSTPLDDE